MRNYFNYFTEIEERFQRRPARCAPATLALNSALIETWREAGIPLEAVLRRHRCGVRQDETRQKRGGCIALMDSLGATQAV